MRKLIVKLLACDSVSCFVNVDFAIKNTDRILVEENSCKKDGLLLSWELINNKLTNLKVGNAFVKIKVSH